MEKQQVVFFRNLLLRVFVVGVTFGLLYLILTISFWDTWVSFFGMWKIEEKDAAMLMAAVTDYTCLFDTRACRRLALDFQDKLRKAHKL